MALTRYAISLLLCASVAVAYAERPNLTVSVTGTGSSIDEAKTDAVRQALQQTLAQLVVVNREISGDALIRDKVMSTMNGYVERLDVQKIAKTAVGYAVTAVVTVSASRIENFIGIASSPGGTFDAGSLVAEQARRKAQINADVLQRRARGQIFDNLMRGFPSNALSLRTRGISLSDKDPDEFRIVIEASFKEDFKTSLEGTVRALSAMECAPYEIKAGDTSTAHFVAAAYRTKQICLSGRGLLSGGPKQQVVVCLSYETVLRCYGLEPGDYCATCQRDVFSLHIGEGVRARQLVVYGRFVDGAGQSANASVPCLERVASPDNLFAVFVQKGDPVGFGVFDFATRTSTISVRSGDVYMDRAQAFISVGAFLSSPRLIEKQRVVTSLVNDHNAQPSGCAVLNEAIQMRHFEGVPKPTMRMFR